MLLVPLLCGAAPIDWKVYNFGKIDGVLNVYLYEAGSLKHLPATLVSVWTEALDTNELLKNPLSIEAIARVNAKVTNGYQPPAVKDKTMTEDNTEVTAAVEEQADEAKVSARSQVLWEFDCAGGVQRILSATKTTGNEKMESYEGASGWQHFAPGSIGDSLSRAICP